MVIFKYIIAIILLYLFIKAVAGTQIDNKQIAILIVLILIIMIGVDYSNSNYKNCSKEKETFDPDRPYIVKSIYDPTNKTKFDVNRLSLEQQSELINPFRNPDVEELINLTNADKSTIVKLAENANLAKQRIKDNYKYEMKYTKTNPFNTIPLGSQIYDYTFLPPENWFRGYEQPPVCITNDRCQVSPSMGSNEYLPYLMEFDTAAHITGPEGIDLEYVQNKLNQGYDYKTGRKIKSLIRQNNME
jgi:hypothetical protein